MDLSVKRATLQLLNEYRTAGAIRVYIYSEAPIMIDAFYPPNIPGTEKIERTTSSIPLIRGDWDIANWTAEMPYPKHYLKG